MWLIQGRMAAYYFQRFWGLFLSCSINYFVQSTSTPQVKLTSSPSVSVCFCHTSITTTTINFLKYLTSCFLLPHIQVYIVYLGFNHIGDPGLTFNYHLQLLSTVFTWSHF